jgi:site-specific recombinase XerD
MKRHSAAPSFATLVRDFFGQRLIQQQNASHCTVASYRDTFRLLLGFYEKQRRKGGPSLTLADIDAPTVLAFLNHLEAERGNAPRTRNLRLAAVRSFVRYAAARDPSYLAHAQRILAIPSKRFDKPMLGYLTQEELSAVLEAPDAKTWSGCRDRALFAFLYKTGARVSEAIGVQRGDVDLAQHHTVRLHGKGRKERVIPLSKDTAAQLRSWLRRIGAAPDGPLFPNTRGQPLSRSGVEQRRAEAVTLATAKCPSLRKKNISPHTLRHTAAMHMLQAKTDTSLIALYLGHESPETMHQYVEANLALKEEALSTLAETPLEQLRFKPDDALLAFLEQL